MDLGLDIGGSCTIMTSLTISATFREKEAVICGLTKAVQTVMAIAADGVRVMVPIVYAVLRPVCRGNVTHLADTCSWGILVNKSAIGLGGVGINYRWVEEFHFFRDIWGRGGNRWCHNL